MNTSKTLAAAVVAALISACATPQVPSPITDTAQRTPQLSTLAKLINDAGLIPDLAGTTTTNPVNQQMLDFAAKDGLTAYPMLDNVVQGDVVDSGNKLLPPILAGKTTPTDALGQLNTVWRQLPDDQRTSNYS